MFKKTLVTAVVLAVSGAAGLTLTDAQFTGKPVLAVLAALIAAVSGVSAVLQLFETEWQRDLSVSHNKIGDIAGRRAT